MSHFIIIELESGFLPVQVPEGKSAIEVAKDHGATLTDEGPYRSFQEAEDVLATMPNPYEAEKQSLNG